MIVHMPALLGRLCYKIVRFLPGATANFLRVHSLRMQGMQIGCFVNIGLGTSFYLPKNPCMVKGAIGNRVNIDEFCDFSAGVYIGDNVSIGKYVSCLASPPHSISIGDDCLIAKGCFIRTDDHIYDSSDYPIRLQGRRGTSIEIGSNVWLGVNVVLLKHSSIGPNAVIGACSLVNRRIPAGVVAVGVPAKPIKTIKDQ